MPFFDHSGKELEREESKSRHVYATATEVLTRDQLRTGVAKGGYNCQVVDPSDLRPLANGPLEGECVLISKTNDTLERLARHRTRKNLLGARDIVLIDLVVECPFDVAQVLGPAEGLEVTFGADGAKILMAAKSLYAVNAPSQASPMAPTVLADVSQIIAKEVGGAIYDFESGRFVALV